MDKKPIGLTKMSGFEFGLRKTLPVSVDLAWQFLTSPAGIRIWLGESRDFALLKGAVYHTVDGASGIVRVVNPEDNLRLTWQPLDWTKPSTIQVRVIPAGDKTTISFHQENLPDAESREMMRQRWEEIMAKIEKELNV
ncbi:MAG TPA: SRPBCC domain-containing protein [Leptolinea sp.]